MADMKHYAVNEDELADLAIVGNKEYVGVVNVVLAADAAAHEAAAVAAARAEGGRTTHEAGCSCGVTKLGLHGHCRCLNVPANLAAYEQGQRDAEARIRAAVEALGVWRWRGGDLLPRDAVLAVIDAAPQDEKGDNDDDA